MIAEYERAQIAERTRRGRLHRARSGSAAVLAAPPTDTGTCVRQRRRRVLQIDEAKAPVVREVFRRYGARRADTGGDRRLAE